MTPPSPAASSKPALKTVKPASGRRFRYALQSFSLLFAVTACCAFGIILADRFPERWDATATREHQLSQRTLDLLKSLDGPYQLIVAANFASSEPLAARRTQDVLDNFARATPNIRTTAIDVSSSKGLADLDALLTELLKRFRPAIEAQQSGLDKALTNAGLISHSWNALSDDLLATDQTVSENDPNAEALHRFLTDSAAVCRVNAQNLESAIERSRQTATTTLGRSGVPATEDAIVIVRKSLADGLSQLKEISDGADAMTRAADAAVSQRTRDRIRPGAQAAATLRDDLGRTITAIDDLPTTPLASVARALERSSAAIVMAPPRAGEKDTRPAVTSLDVSTLFPPKPQPGQQVAQLDLRARTEELLAAAVASLARDDAPIIVLVHGAPSRLSPQFTPFAALLDRLRLRGMMLVEWAVAVDAQQPSLTAVNPGGKRPVVYATVPTNESTPDGMKRFNQLAKVIAQLVDEGKPVLLSLNPSLLPGSGQSDPMVSFLGSFGVQADSGRPLLQQAMGAQGRVVAAELTFNTPNADHAVSRAIAGLNTRLLWPVPLRLTSDATGVTPILVADNAGKTIWAEAEWADFRRVPIRDRAMLSNPPANDSQRDDGAGPWTLAIAIKRGSPRPANLIVVGSNGWYLDEITQGQQVVDGRPVLFNPGNIELFEASIYALAGEEGMIGTSAQAASAPLIPPLDERMTRVIRWSLIGGLPLLILLAGALWRLIRG